MERWIFTVNICVGVLSVVMINFQVMAMNQCQTDSDLVCCTPCSSDSATCTKKCPQGFYVTNDTSQCFQTSLPTTTPMVNTTDNSNTDQEVCARECVSGTYFDNNMAKCCHPVCLNCTGAGSSNCDVCKITYNSTCVEHCPDGYKVVGGLCEEDEDDKTIIIIAAAGGGGGLIVIIIIIVVVVCCCCRRQNAGRIRRPISILAEKKSSRPATTDEDEDPKPEVGTRSRTRPPGYENTAIQPNNLGQQVQQQRDVVGRYTKDPTLNVNKNRKKHGRQEVESVYANSAMINLHREIDTSSLTREEMDHQLEQVELAELGEAPSAPQSVKLRKKTSKRGTIVKKMRRISEKFSFGRKQVQTEQAEADQPDYLDMSGGTADSRQLEGYETVDVAAMKPRNITHTKQKSLPAPPSSVPSSRTDLSAVKPTVKKAETFSARNVGMEDYENTSFSTHDNKKEQKRTKRRDAGAAKTTTDKNEVKMEDYANMTKSAAKSRATVKHPKDGSDSDEMEDYENVTAKAAKKAAAAKTGEDDGEDNMEDYENMKELAGAVGGMKGSVDKEPAGSGNVKLDDYQNMGKKMKGVEAAVDSEGEDLQDYENSGQFKKLAESELQPYENYSFK